MTFTFEGFEYRIAFQHDRPKDWDAHVSHKVSLDAEGLSCEAYAAKSGHQRCDVALAGVSPEMTRHLKSIARQLERTIDRLGSGITVAAAEVLKRHVGGIRRMLARELARDVRCTIYRRQESESVNGATLVDWHPLYSGRSRLNTSKGDQYEREEGRVRALRDALPDTAVETREFRRAAVKAYFGRTRARMGAGR